MVTILKMLTVMKRQGRSALFAVLLLGGQGVAQAHFEPTNPVSLELIKTSVTSGEPVLLQMQVKNVGGSPLEIDLGTNEEDGVLMSVIDPKGRRHEKPAPPIRQGMTFFGWRRLSAGEEYSKIFILNEWFEFKDSGQYLIQVRLLKSPIAGSQPLQTGPSSMALEVTPYDSEKLANTCRNLVSLIRTRDTADQYIRAATAERALSYVHDPMVVAYWDQVLEYASHSAIASLYKIGNAEAVRVLGHALQLRNAEARREARSALQAIARDTSDPSIRVQVEDILNRS